MVARDRRPAAKTLIRQDGTQLAAQVGMVDRDGVMFNVLDVGTKRLEFHPMSWIAQDMEADNERLRYDLADACEQGERAMELFERAVGLSDELLACGKFPYGTKTKYQLRASRLRKALKEMLEHGE